MNTPLVSTIIPAYNRPHFLREAIDSVIAQNYRPIEIILVDDGSTDNETPALIASLAANHPEIIPLHQQNAGPGPARQTGLEASSGPFIQYLDSDDRLLPAKFKRQVNALLNNPSAGIAYGITRLIDASGTQILREPYKWTDRTFKHLLPALLVDRWWNTHTPLWRREVCAACGPWPALPTGEDWAYEANAASHNIRLIHTPETLSETRQHDHPRQTENPHLTPQLITALNTVQQTLFQACRTTDLSADSPEMKHFTRWNFFLAREAAAQTLPHIAAPALQRAAACALPGSASARQITLFSTLRRTLGWKNAARIAALRQPNQPGNETLLSARSTS